MKINDKTVVLIYINHRREAGVRTITPIAIYFGATDYYPEYQWLMDCWDHDKNATRTYAMKDISSWMPYKETPVGKSDT